MVDDTRYLLYLIEISRIYLFTFITNRQSTYLLKDNKEILVSSMLCKFKNECNFMLRLASLSFQLELLDIEVLLRDSMVSSQDTNSANNLIYFKHT